MEYNARKPSWRPVLYALSALFKLNLRQRIKHPNRNTINNDLQNKYYLHKLK